MRKALLTITIALSLLSCKEGITPEEAAEELKNINYVQDERSGLCFAVTIEWGEYDSGRGLATVPCEKVKHLIVGYGR